MQDAVGEYRMPDQDELRTIIWFMYHPRGAPRWVRRWSQAGGMRLPPEESVQLFLSYKKEYEAARARR